MSAFITVIHVLICLILIVAVLLQSGKAADLAGAFGGVGSQTAFGPRGTATILSKITTISAVLFMVTSMGLWRLSFQGESSGGKGQPAGKPAAAATTTPGTKPSEQPSAPAQKPANVQAAPAAQAPTQAPAAAPKTEPQKKEPTPQTKPK